MSNHNQDKCFYCQVLAMTEFDLPEDDGRGQLYNVKIAGRWLDQQEIEYIWAMGYCPDHGEYKRQDHEVTS